MTSTHGSHNSHGNSLHNSSSGTDGIHSVSFGGNAGFPNNKLDGSLTILVKAMNDVRNSMQSPNALQSIPSSEKISPATVPKIMNNVTGLASRRYKSGTFNMNAKAGNTHRNSGALTSDGLSPVPVFDQHASSGAQAHGNTNSYNLQNVIYDLSYSYDVSTPSGKVLLLKRNEIFNAMNNKKITGTKANKNFSWTITGNTHNNHGSCSREVKKDIFSYFGSALEIISRTEIVSFRYKDDPAQILHYGFIAEDTAPELATEFHDRMDYTNCIGILIKAVQELKQEVDELRSGHSI